MNLGLNVEVVRDHHVVDDGLQNLVDFAFRSEQSDLLQPVDDVQFSLAFPLALRFDRRGILSLLALVLNGLRSIDRDLGELGVAPQIFQVISPEPRLRFVSEASAPDGT